MVRAFLLFTIQPQLWYNFIMKTRSMRLPLFIITSLIFFSFAFYLHAQETPDNSANVFSSDPTSTDSSPSTSDATTDPTDNSQNLTQQVAQQITDLTNSNNTNNQQVSMDEISSLVDSALNPSTTNVNLPQIDQSDIKIEKQNYTGSAKEITAKKKEDFENYIVAVYYILASNSPTPITSSADITSAVSSTSGQILSAIDTGDTSSLQNLSDSGGKMLDELKQVEVPEEMVDIQIKAMSFAMYAQQLTKTIKPNSGDPLGDIANLSKVEGLVMSLSSFSDEVGQKFTEYNITYSSDIEGKLKNMGLDTLTDQSLIQQLSQ